MCDWVFLSTADMISKHSVSIEALLQKILFVGHFRPIPFSGVHDAPTFAMRRLRSDAVVCDDEQLIQLRKVAATFFDMCQISVIVIGIGMLLVHKWARQSDAPTLRTQRAAVRIVAAVACGLVAMSLYACWASASGVQDRSTTPRNSTATVTVLSLAVTGVVLGATAVMIRGRVSNVLPDVMFV